MFSNPDLVNSRGDTLSLQEQGLLGNVDDATAHVAGVKPTTLDPARRAELLTNWLTAGGPPKALDLSKMFGEVGALAPVKSKAAAGQGIGGLFGAGLVVGEIAPLKPINQSPLQTAYSAPALPKVGQ